MECLFLRREWPFARRTKASNDDQKEPKPPVSICLFIVG